MATSSGVVGSDNDPLSDMEEEVHEVFPIEIFQSARVCLNIYGQQNVCLCTIATDLQWVKGFVIVSNPIWFSGARAHLGTRM
jgi:hypothetical protein